jgi:demethylmenaquinone methyltransferase / 2-methoxy-6-polyprenyl-1,4-benzoquinol methylase
MSNRDRAKSSWARRNREMFDVVSRRYDALNLALSFGLDRHWRRRAVERLGVVGEQRLLDVGTGTADVAIAIARRDGRATVVGVDPSREMILRGRVKVAGQRLTDRIELIVGDGVGLALRDASFDGAISAFCIRNVEDRLAFFLETRRVLRPGGRVVALELTRPTAKLLREGHRVYNARVVPLLGRLVSDGAAYRYLIDSIEGFPERAVILDELGRAGFSDLEATPLTGGVVTVFSGIRQEEEADPCLTADEGGWC